jgi:hypothetical protein
MELFFTADLHEEDIPSGFVPGRNDHHAFAQAEGWEKQTCILRSLPSFFHKWVTAHSTLGITQLT